MNDPGGLLYFIYTIGIKSGAFPLIIFMGIGTLTDFGPMLANPKTALLGAAAQFGIFTTLIGALLLSEYVPGIDFNLWTQPPSVLSVELTDRPPSFSRANSRHGCLGPLPLPPIPTWPWSPSFNRRSCAF